MKRVTVSSIHIFYLLKGLIDFYEIWHRGDRVNVAEWIYLCLWYENTKIISGQKKHACRIIVYKSLSFLCFFFWPTSGIKQALYWQISVSSFLGWVASTFTSKWGTLHGVKRQLLLNKYGYQGKVVSDGVVWYLWCYGHCDGTCVSAVSDPPDLWCMKNNILNVCVGCSKLSTR